MCLIIVTDEPSKVRKKIMASAAKYNSDGVGVMWYDAHGKLQVKKWLHVPLRKWWKEWRQICKEAESAGSQVAIHLRMATHGDVCEDMTHPYAIQAKDGEVQMMHNGIIRGYGQKPVKDSNIRAVSDTYEYARRLEDMLKVSGKGLIANQTFRELVGDDIGDNRFVFGYSGNSTKDFFIVNEDTGVVYQGHWFSNTYAWDYEEITGLKAPGHDDGDEDAYLDYVQTNPEDAISYLKQCVGLGFFTRDDDAKLEKLTVDDVLGAQAQTKAPAFWLAHLLKLAYPPQYQE